ncbi:hypothetical protein AHMF7605_11790 [Adhaeribacter arboris]|uniref:Uncharacterized protein n=1 Tax=Adhaeribacter arboris TaxID=2072846 RepID=A0A2T2YF91_9BACT|nr:hypothetical protein [Adhaeribacter arboris]PSR54153.1 hypothetical protein AHMF7605_11790 [Adhaeribacter arboris]
MYALVKGYQNPGEDCRQIEYKEIACAEDLSELAQTFCQAIGESEDAVEDYKRYLTECPKAFLSVGEDTKSLYGKDYVYVHPRSAKKSYGPLLRFIEV